MTDRSPGLYGRLPGKIPVGLRELGYYVAGDLPKAPVSVDCPRVGAWGMLGNDTYGDCGVAGLEHVFMANSSIVSETETEATAAQAISYYLDYTGGQDTGVVLSDYLAHVRTAGYYGHHVNVYAPVAVHDVPTLQTAIWIYGAAYTGIVVTAAMQEAFGNGQPWTTALLSQPPEGGHCVPAIGYDETYLYVVTWGAIQSVTWPAWHYMSSEAWAIVTGEFVAHHGDGRGVNLAALNADLDRLAA